MIKPAFIVPDWKDRTSFPAYVNMAAAFRDIKSDVLGYDFIWTSGTVRGWTERLQGALEEQQQPAVACAVGLGGMIALITSASVPIEHLILCSPKGYFKEYVDHSKFIPARWMGDTRLAEFASLSARDVFANMKVKSGLIIMDHSETVGKPMHAEWLQDLVTATGWPVIDVPHQPYGVKGPAYQKAIVKAVKASGLSDEN